MLWFMVHIPKTAGTSFRKSMRGLFGQSMILDYEDKPIKVPRWQRNWKVLLQGRASARLAIPDGKCIFGHYMPLKYCELLNTRQCTLVTWLRNPIARMVSHYNFIFEHYDKHQMQPGMSRVVDENWSIERFMFSPMYRNYASQWLWGVPLSRFDFVGVVEHYEEDLIEFGKRYFGRRLRVHQEKCGSNKPLCEFLVDSKARRRAERYHQRDMELYQAALHMRAVRRKQWSMARRQNLAA